MTAGGRKLQEESGEALVKKNRGMDVKKEKKKRVVPKKGIRAPIKG